MTDSPRLIHPVVLCGGSGTRLWPASRKAYPKQFVPLIGDQSLYQATLSRFSGTGFAAPVVMTGETFRFMATDQAEAIGLSDAHVVVEPSGRDTAPAILAAALLLQDAPDDLMLVAPSDHVITDLPAFHKAVDSGRELAESGALVTFGIAPDRPETGFGYLEMEAATKLPSAVRRFREKPSRAEAEAMVAEGRFLWNAGLFLGRVKDFIQAFENHAPDLISPVSSALDGAEKDLSFTRLAGESWDRARAISVDYAIMEKASNVAAVPVDCGWSDLGSWEALWSAAGPDSSGNALAGEATAVDCEGSYLRSEVDGMHLVGLGLKDTVAVAMSDAVLIADRGRVQDVKKVVDTLKAAKIAQAEDYPRFHRPWGWYETLCLGERFQVKRIMVKPDGILSLQSHRHRSEHWVVVAGTAEVTIGETRQLVSENQSVYIPLGEKHRMANPGKVPMYLIEVQTGAYLGEDDIVRYEDVYGRG